MNNEMIKFTLEHLEGIASSFSLILSLITFNKMIKDNQKNNEDKKIEIYMDLSKDWHDIWSKITAYPQSNKEIFSKSIREIDDENLRFELSSAVNLLSRVHYYYEKTNQNITLSDWQKTVEYVFSKPVFASIYRKHEKRYSSSFCSYIESILNKNNIININITNNNNKKIIR